MRFYNFDIDDYRAATAHLSMEEHYIYRWLIDEYYETEQPIPHERRLLMRRMRLTSDQAELLDIVLDEFFDGTEEGYVHARIEGDLEKIYAKSAKARASAEARWKKKGKKGKSDTDAMRTHTPSNADVMRKDASAMLPTNLLTLLTNTIGAAPPESLNISALEEYKKHRQEIKAKKLTSKGWVLKAKKMALFSSEVQQAAVDATIENGWTGLFPEKVNEDKRRSGRSGQNQSKHSEVSNWIEEDVRNTLQE